MQLHLGEHRAWSLAAQPMQPVRLEASAHDQHAEPPSPYLLRWHVVLRQPSWLALPDSKHCGMRVQTVSIVACVRLPGGCQAASQTCRVRGLQCVGRGHCVTGVMLHRCAGAGEPT